MLIICPSCSKKYIVNIGHFRKDDQKVCCAQCRHIWVIHSPLKIKSEEDKVEPELKKEPVKNDPISGRPVRIQLPAIIQTKYKKNNRLLSITLGSIAVLFAVSLIIFGRSLIITTFPFTNKIYSYFNLAINGAGLVITDISVSPISGQQTNIIKARIVNLTHQKISIPPIRVIATDSKTGQWLQDWTFRPENKDVEKLESVAIEIPSYNMNLDNNIYILLEFTSGI
ncbi:MAG: zinc-ribbon domain-containing protein [Alphaproteobacteria bacterium]|nr:zinc-ribbon domain-containing protein [Alphaproteobacteria bacterium]